MFCSYICREEKEIYQGGAIMKGMRLVVVVTVILVGAVFTGCSKKNTSAENRASSSQNMHADTQRAEKPVAPEKNPPGDIPDNQAFVTYISAAGGYELEVPEGWARKTNGMNVVFTEKLDGLSTVLTNSSQTPGVESIRADQAEKLKKTGRAVTIKKIKDVKLASGPAVLMVYESNSEPDPVTAKQMRLENDTFFFFKKGRIAELRLWAPLGADNVDQWKRISNSFRWR